MVAKLIRVQDPATTTALEVAAGGKLYQVGHDSVLHAAAPEVLCVSVVRWQPPKLADAAAPGWGRLVV